MKKLNEMPSGSKAKIAGISGSKRFLSRITSIGFTIGNEIEVVKNTKKQPILVYARDTLVAVNRAESEFIKLVGESV